MLFYKNSVLVPDRGLAKVFKNRKIKNVVKGDVVARQTAESAVPWFDSRFSHNDPDVLQDHCVILYKSFMRPPKTFR